MQNKGGVGSCKRLKDKYFPRNALSGETLYFIPRASRTMLRIMSGNMKAWNGNMEYQ